MLLKSALYLSIAIGAGLSPAQAQRVTSPITPVQASPTAGKTVKITTNGVTSVPSTLTLTATIQASRILVTNSGTNAAGGDPGTGVVAFIRVSGEAVPVAAATDVPLAPGQSIILLNPVPAGVVGLAVVSSGTTNVDIFFTPIEGGM